MPTSQPDVLSTAKYAKYPKAGSLFSMKRLGAAISSAEVAPFVSRWSATLLQLCKFDPLNGRQLAMLLLPGSGKDPHYLPEMAVEPRLHGIVDLAE